VMVLPLVKRRWPTLERIPFVRVAALYHSKALSLTQPPAMDYATPINTQTTRSKVRIERGRKRCVESGTSYMAHKVHKHFNLLFGAQQFGSIFAHFCAKLFDFGKIELHNVWHSINGKYRTQ